MIEFAPSAPLENQPESLLWAWHNRAYQEAVESFKDGDFPRMHQCYKRLSEIRAELDSRLIFSVGASAASTGAKFS